MPILPNAKKALRQTEKKTEFNRRVRSRMKTFIDSAFSDKNINAVSNAFSAIDRAVKNNLLHKNKAARLKSRLSKVLVDVADAIEPKSKEVKKTTTKSLVKAKSTTKPATKAKPASTKKAKSTKK